MNRILVSPESSVISRAGLSLLLVTCFLAGCEQKLKVQGYKNMGAAPAADKQTEQEATPTVKASNLTTTAEAIIKEMVSVGKGRNSSELPVNNSSTGKAKDSAAPVVVTDNGSASELPTQLELPDVPALEGAVLTESPASVPVALPIADDATIALPVTEMAADSTVETLATEQPLIEQPLAEQPLAEQPLAEQPLAEQPLAEQPLAEQPLAELPLIEEPVAQELVSQEITAPSETLAIAELPAAGLPDAPASVNLAGDVPSVPAAAAVPTYPASEPTAVVAPSDAVPPPELAISMGEILANVDTTRDEADAIAQTLNEELAKVDKVLDKNVVTQKCEKYTGVTSLLLAGKTKKDETCAMLNQLQKSKKVEKLANCVGAVYVTFRMKWASGDMTEAKGQAQKNENDKNGAILVQKLSKDKLAELTKKETKTTRALGKVEKLAQKKQCK